MACTHGEISVELAKALGDLARLTADNEALRKVLRGIANATRFDRQVFDDDTAFVDWAQSVARHAIKEGS